MGKLSPVLGQRARTLSRSPVRAELEAERLAYKRSSIMIRPALNICIVQRDCVCMIRAGLRSAVPAVRMRPRKLAGANTPAGQTQNAIEGQGAGKALSFRQNLALVIHDSGRPA